MPSKSKKQQRLMGMAYAAKKGELDKSKLSPEILKIMNSMSRSQIRDFAKTKSSNLPETSKKEASENEKEDKDCCSSSKDNLKEKLKLIVEKNGISKIKGGNTRALNLKQYKISKKAAAVDPDYASGFRSGLDENTPINANITLFENPFKGLTRHRSAEEWENLGLMGGLGTLGYMGGSMVSDNPVTKGITTLAGLATAKYLIDTGKNKDLKNFFKDFYSAVKGPTHSKFRDWAAKYVPYLKYPDFTERMKSFYDKKFASTSPYSMGAGGSPRYSRGISDQPGMSVQKIDNSAVSNTQLNPTQPVNKQPKKPWYKRIGDNIGRVLKNTYMGGGSSMGMLATKPGDAELIMRGFNEARTGNSQQYNKLVQERKNMRAMGLDPSDINQVKTYNPPKFKRINPATGKVQHYIGPQGKSEDSSLDLELLQAAQQGKPLSSGAIEAARSSLEKQLAEQKEYLDSIDPNNKLDIQTQQKYINDLKSRVNQFTKEVLPLKDSLANRRALRANPEKAVTFGDEAEIAYGKSLTDENNPINKLRNRQQSITNNYLNNREFANDNIASLKADYQSNPNDPRAAENYRRGLSAISTATREKQRQQYLKSMSSISPEERNALLERQRQAQKVQAEDERLGLSGRSWNDKDIQWAKSQGYTDEQISQAMKGGKNEIRPDVIENMKRLQSKPDIGEKYYDKKKEPVVRRLNNLD